jgi:hypothetical protein
MAKLSGGGISSNKVTSSKSAWKVEPKAQAVSPAGVNQMSLSTQFRKDPLAQGAGYSTKPMGSTGIANARFNSASAGPGSGRTIYKSGSQSPTPPAKPVRPGRSFDE